MHTGTEMCVKSTKIFLKKPLTLYIFPIIIKMFTFVNESVARKKALRRLCEVAMYTA